MTTIRPTSKITEVTVFESSAQVRRVATIERMPKGEVSVVFADLPQGLDRDNVQVAVRHGAEGDANAGTCTLRGVSFKTESVEVAAAAPSSERAALADKLKQLRADLTDAEDRLADCVAQGAFFRQCADSALKGERADEDRDGVFSSPDKWKAMLETTAAEDASSLAAQRVAQKRVDEISKLIAATQSDLNSRGGAARVAARQVVVVVLLVSKELENVDVRVSYVVGSAAWTAEYDVRFDPEKNEAKVTYNAVVTQTGGEAWPNAILTISTARPTISGKPSELQPWRAKIYVAPPPTSHLYFASQSLGCAESSKMQVCRDEAEEECIARSINLAGFIAPQIETATVKEGATSMTFCLENHPYTVGNDGKPVRVALAVVPVKSELAYISRPKLTETVFATLQATNLSEFTLLAGPALVFCGQQFVAKTALVRVSPGDTFNVSLGADNDVTIKYRRLRTERAEAGGMLAGRKIKMTVATNITIKNRKRVPVDIVVEDQVPVSQHSDIEVAMIEPPPPEEKTPAHEKLLLGLVEFSLKLAPQQEKQLAVEFAVKHPVDFQMEGL